MNNYAVVQLNAIAKERGIRGNYKLRKVELINALEVARLVEQKSNIFDESIPNDSSPVLQPNTLEAIKYHEKIKQNLKKNLY